MKAHPPKRIHTRPLIPQTREVLPPPIRVHTARTMHLLHLDALLALGLLFHNAQLLEVHVGAIEDGAGVSGVGPFLGAEGAELAGLGLGG